MIIRILEAADVESYRHLRLESLTTDPEAFGSTYEREAAFSLETVRDRLVPTDYKFTMGAYDGKDMLVGIVTFVRDTNAKTAHKGNVYGMFVSPDWRGKGVGRALMAAMLQKASAQSGLEQVNLTVVTDNAPARKLYESLGFITYGCERQALKYRGRYYDEDLMVYRY
jgi:RimJ/RimL family protein N-acetyltransferase